MSTTRILHNPRCSKSRQTLALLEENNESIEIVEYLKTPPSVEELNSFLQTLNMQARDLMRKGEAEYKELNLKDDSLSEQELVKAMAENPRLIERPIVIKDGKVAIGRPPESVLEIL